MSAFLLTARPQKYTEFNHLIVYQKQRVGLKCIKDLIKSINKMHETSVNTRRKQYNLQYPNQDFKFLPLALHRKTVKMSVVSSVDLYIPTDLFEIKITLFIIKKHILCSELQTIWKTTKKKVQLVKIILDNRLLLKIFVKKFF